MKAFSKRFLCFAGALCISGAAAAVDYRVSVSGIFNLIPDTAPAGNQLANLLGTSFTASVIASDSPGSTLYTELGNDPDSRGWCFCKAPYLPSAAANGFAFTNGETVVVSVTNNFVYGGGVVAAGTYDEIEWTGWLYDSGSGSLQGSPYVPGVNYTFSIGLAGLANLLANSSSLPPAALNLNDVVYGYVDVTKYFDGEVVGEIALDPPLRLEGGQLVGPGMSVSISAVPEPSTAVLLCLGVGVVFARRASSRNASA